jgi:hypothetical protein
MDDYCKGNRLCQIRKVRQGENSIIDPLFVVNGQNDMSFKRNKLVNDINSYVEIRDPMLVRSPNKRSDANYGEIIDPLFREYFDEDNCNNKCFYKWIIIMSLLFLVYLYIMQKN